MIIALRPLTVGRAPLAEGDVIREFEGRCWGRLMSTSAVVELSPNAINSVLIEAMPRSDEPEGGVLIGSDIQPAKVRGETGNYFIESLVSTAFRNSELSVMAWNALPPSARETLIWAESVLDGDDIPTLEEHHDKAALAGPGDPPEGPHMLFDPERHSLKYRGSVVGYWIVEGDSNVAQIDKAEYRRLKVCDKAGMSAYVELTESDDEDQAAGAEPGESGDQAAAA